MTDNEPVSRSKSPLIDVAFETRGWSYGLRIDYDESASAHEVAREVIKSTIEPYNELEQRGVLKNVRVVLFGGTVTKPKPLKDYDLLVLYDEAHKPSARDTFSDNTKTILWRLFPEKGGANENEAYLLNIYRDQYAYRDRLRSERASILPEFVEIWLRSKRNYLASLNETPDQIRKRAFLTLIDLPDVMVADGKFYDGILYEFEQEEADKQPAIALCLLLARAFNYSFSKEELSYLAGRYPKSEYGMEISALRRIVDPEKLPDTPEGKREADKRIDQYILEMHHSLKVTPDELADFLSGRINEQQKRHFIKVVVNRFTESVKSEIGDRVRWIYEGLTRNTNPERGAVESGQLIKGNNIEINGTPLFSEDKTFLL